MIIWLMRDEIRHENTGALHINKPSSFFLNLSTKYLCMREGGKEKIMTSYLYIVGFYV